MMDVEEAIKSFQDFENRATSKRETQISRIKEDRAVLAGDQWGKDDKRLVGRGRVRRTVNITANAVNSIVNNYLGFEYAFFSGDQQLDGLLDAWLKAKSNSRSVKDGLHGSVAFGLNYLCLGTDTLSDSQGSMEIPVVYTVPDVENILFDCDSIEPDGSDAVEAAIIEIRSKNYIKAKFGEDYLQFHTGGPKVNVSYNHNEDAMAIVTYYKVEDGKCTCYRMLGDRFLQDPVQINIDRPPIIPIYGEQTWDDDEIIYQGIVRKATPIQRLVNLCFTQLGERMAMAPKPTWLTTPEAIEGYSEGYKTFQYNINPLLLWNDKSEDLKRDLPKPERLDNHVEFSDLTGIIASNLQLMSSITGVDSRGAFDNKDSITATEVLSEEKQYQTQIRHYFDNLKCSFRCLGELVLKLFGYGDITLDVTQGPDEALQRQIARNELITLAGIVPDPQKPAIVDGILMCSGNNAILRDVYGAIHQVPAPTAMEQEMGMTIEQMKAAIEERDQKMQEMQDELQYYRNSRQDQEENRADKFAELQIRHRQDMEKLQFKAALTAADQEARFQQDEIKHEQQLEEIALKNQLEAGDRAADRQADEIIAGMEVEKEQLALDTQRMKSAAEQTKAMASMMQPEGGKNEDSI